MPPEVYFWYALYFEVRTARYVGVSKKTRLYSTEHMLPSPGDKISSQLGSNLLPFRSFGWHIEMSDGQVPGRLERMSALSFCCSHYHRHALQRGLHHARAAFRRYIASTTPMYSALGRVATCDSRARARDHDAM